MTKTRRRDNRALRDWKIMKRMIELEGKGYLDVARELNRSLAYVISLENYFA